MSRKTNGSAIKKLLTRYHILNGVILLHALIAFGILFIPFWSSSCGGANSYNAFQHSSNLIIVLIIPISLFLFAISNIFCKKIHPQKQTLITAIYFVYLLFVLLTVAIGAISALGLPYKPCTIRYANNGELFTGLTYLLAMPYIITSQNTANKYLKLSSKR